MILRAIANLIESDSELRSGHQGRVYWHRRPQSHSEFPMVLVSQLAVRPLDVLDGRPTCDLTTVEVDAWFEDAEDALKRVNAAEKAVRRLLEGLSGPIAAADGSTNSIDVQGSVMVRNDHTAVPPQPGSNTFYRIASLDFQITHANGVHT